MARWIVCLGLVASSCTPAGPQPSERPVGTVARPLGTTSVAKNGVAASDRFVWAVGNITAEEDTPEKAALRYLEHFLPLYGAGRADLRLVHIEAVHDRGDGGYIVWASQKANGLAVLPSQARVLMKRDLSLVAVAGRVEPIAQHLAPFTAHMGPDEALALAVQDTTGLPFRASDLVELVSIDEDFRRYTAAQDLPVVLPDARVRPIYYYRSNDFRSPTLEPAWFVELYAGEARSTESEAFRYIISSTTGEVLDRRDLTHSDAFTYRVWADRPPFSRRTARSPTLAPTPPGFWIGRSRSWCLGAIGSR